MKQTLRYSTLVVLSAVTVVLTAAAALSAQQSAPERRHKKLVEYGWDVPYPDQVRKNIRAMEKLPFDGIIFRLRDWNHAFDPRPWDEAKLRPQLDDLAAIQWKTFTDNFLCLYAANNWNMDWFNDEQWKGIAANLRLSAKAARIGRCVGLVFDPEPYGENPWAYAGKNKEHSFAEVEAQVRKRGAEFMRAIQAELPNVRLLTFFHQSLFGGIYNIADAKQRQLRLSQQHWALLSAFWNGALEAAAPGARIIDGHEHAYYFTKREQFVAARDAIKRGSLGLVPPELHAKHAVNVEAGMALYVDQVFAMRKPRERYLSAYLTPAAQLQWFEHNVYYALADSDQYVWCYSEHMNWWKGDVPAGLEAAIRSARDKYFAGRALGFDIAASLGAGWQRMNDAAKAKKPQQDQKKPQQDQKRPQNDPKKPQPKPAASAVPGAWKAHVVRRLGGSGGEERLPAQLQIVTDSWNRVVAVPYIAYVPEKDRLLMLVSCDYPHHPMLLESGDRGATWSQPRNVGLDTAGQVLPALGTSLAYLGGGNVVFYTNVRWFSRDFGKTWGETTPVAPVDGRQWAIWDPPLVDRDPKTGRLLRLLETGYTGTTDGGQRGYLRFSIDGGKTWSSATRVPQWEAVSEVALIRAANNDLVAACRTDMPARMKGDIDHSEGLGISISKDDGKTWSSVKKLYDFGRHHPSLVRLPSGDLVMTYVVRKGYVDASDGLRQFGIEAAVSRDHGQTWDLDHRYILHQWVGHQQGAKHWWPSSQATSSVLLPDGSILTAFGTGYRCRTDARGQSAPRDVGLVQWRLSDKPPSQDRRIRDSAEDSDLRNWCDPVTGKPAVPKKKR